MHGVACTGGFVEVSTALMASFKCRAGCALHRSGRHFSSNVASAVCGAAVASFFFIIAVVYADCRHWLAVWSVCR